MFALATISLVLRLWVKRFMTARRFQLDDWIMLFAWVLSVSFPFINSQAMLLAIVVLLCEIIENGIINLDQASFDDKLLSLRVYSNIAESYLRSFSQCRFFTAQYYGLSNSPSSFFIIAFSLSTSMPPAN
jgi:hypothetical protein